jgi:heavy metal translocating P-type ATPase
LGSLTPRGARAYSLQVWKKRDAIIAVIALASILSHLVLRYAPGTPRGMADLPLFIALACGGAPLLAVLLRQLLGGQFGSDLLAGVAIITSVLLGEYLIASVVVLMLSGGQALEAYAIRRASSVLDALARRNPTAAHRRAGEDLVDIQLDDIRVGDVLVVLPHEICPADGVVQLGSSTMDESYLTGEPFLIRKTTGSAVISGAINGDAALTIAVERRAVDSRYARIMEIVRTAEENRPSMRRLADRLGAWYTPVALLVAAAGWMVSGQPARFLAVIVIATPCPLLLAIPVAIIGSISLAAKRGIIIKDAALLERIGSCRTVMFDKTGTLTLGQPALTGILCAPGFSTRDALQLAASLELYSKHPLAAAVVREAEQTAVGLLPVTEMSEKAGAGLTGRVADRFVRITGRPKLLSEHLTGLPAEAAGMECLLLVDEIFAAAFRFHDVPRRESQSFVRHLRPKHAMSRVLLVSGDREAEVRYLAGVVGIKDVYFGQSPEQKLAIVNEETRRQHTLFVGDGLNDAPAMMAATVGVAIGQNSDVTAEAAGAVILEGSLAKVDELIHIGNRMKRVALQSAVGGILLSVVGMAAAAVGLLPALAGVIAQEVIDVAAVLNALRAAIPPKDLTDF